MGDKYILKNKEVVECDDLSEWAAWIETADRTVAKETTGNGDVSTVFLGLDHQFGDGPPLVFETLVFNGPMDQEMDRYSTWDEAVAGHAEMVERVKTAQ